MPNCCNFLKMWMLALVGLLPLCSLAADLKDQVLYNQNFTKVALGAPPKHIKDNSAWAGSSAPVTIVDSSNPEHGKVLQCQVNGLAQIILGQVEVQKGGVYRINFSISSLRPQSLEIQLRSTTKPYRNYLTQSLTVSESMSDFTFMGKVANKGGRANLILKMNGYTTLEIDNITIEQVLRPLPQGAPPKAGNLLLNAGFELGNEGWNSRGQIKFIADRDAYEGKKVARMSANELLSSSWYSFSYQSPYLIKARVRALKKPVSGWLSVSDYVHRRGSSFKRRETFKISPEQGWQTVWFRWQPKPSAGIFTEMASAYLALGSDNFDEANLLVDALEAIATSEKNEQDHLFAPHSAIEHALNTDAPRNVVVEGQAIKITAFSTGKEKTLSLNIHDESEALFKQVVVPLNSGQGSIRLANLPSGYWHLQTAPAEASAVAGETFVTVVPTMPEIPLGEWSFGTHASSNNSDIMEASWRLGLRWNRLHDTSKVTKWSNIQPDPETWAFDDKQMAALRDTQSFALLGLLDQLPRWHNEKTKPSSRKLELTEQMIPKWQTYVRKTISHWQNEINYWEVINEPPNWMTPQQYVKTLKNTTAVIRKVDPDAIIVGLGGPDLFSDWVYKAVDLGAAKYSDVVSFHGYGLSTWNTIAGPSTLIHHIERFEKSLEDAGKPNMPIWNSEVGIVLHSNWSKFNWPKYGAAPIEAAYMLPKSVAAALAAKIEKTFYYSAFEYDHPSTVGSFSWLNDINGVSSMPSQSMAVAISLLQGRTFVSADSHETASGIVSVHFKGRGEHVRMLWCNGPTQEMNLPANSKQVLNMWGRPVVTKTKIQLTQAPIYIISSD